MIQGKVSAITSITDFKASFGSALSENLSPEKDRIITHQGSNESTDYLSPRTLLVIKKFNILGTCGSLHHQQTKITVLYDKLVPNFKAVHRSFWMLLSEDTSCRQNKCGVTQRDYLNARLTMLHRVVLGGHSGLTLMKSSYQYLAT